MAQQKTFTLDGKRYRLDQLVPAWQVRDIVGRHHVNDPDAEIERDITERARYAAWPDSTAKSAARYAVACHRANQSLYNKVMGGRI